VPSKTLPGKLLMSCRVFFYSEMPLKFPSPLPQGFGGWGGYKGRHCRRGTAAFDQEGGKTKAIHIFSQ
jgi:hypothetical protein